MTVATSPCDWQVIYSCPDGQAMPEPLASMPASGVALWEGVAADYLWNWTGKVLGLCEEIIRPCQQHCPDGRSTFWGSGPSPAGTWRPVLVGGQWTNISCGRCGDQCGCGGMAPLALPGPVDSVVSVHEDDVEVPASAYHVDNNRLLVRTDGQAWHACGLEIKYMRGVPVPNGGQVAAGVLAVELAKAACNDNSCALPQRVQTITRQGVTIAMLDAFDDVDKGHTGIWLIDSWLASMIQPPAPSRVLSPDRPRHNPRRTTWRAP